MAEIDKKEILEIANLLNRELKERGANLKILVPVDLPEGFYKLNERAKEFASKKWSDTNLQKIAESANLLSDWMPELQLTLEFSEPEQMQGFISRIKAVKDEFGNFLNRAILANTPDDTIIFYKDFKEFFDDMLILVVTRLNAVLRETDVKIN